MKYLNVCQAPEPKVPSAIFEDKLDSDDSYIETALECASELEDMFDKFRNQGVDRASYQLMASKGFGLESTINVSDLTTKPSISGLTIALEDNIKQRVGILQSIISKFKSVIVAFIAWLKEKAKNIREWFSRIRKKKKPVNDKVVAFLAKASKSPDAVVQAITHSLPKDNQDAKRPVVKELTDAYVEQVKKVISKLNENTTAKYVFFNADGVNTFFNGFDRYEVDIERAHGAINLIVNAMTTSDPTTAVEIMRGVEKNIANMPGSEWFDKRNIREDEYQRMSIDVTMSSFLTNLKKCEKAISEVKVIDNADKIIGSIESFVNVIQSSFLKTIDSSFTHLPDNVASSLVSMATISLSKMINVLSSIKNEYVYALKISTALLLINNTFSAELVRVTLDFITRVSEDHSGENLNSLKAFIKNEVGIDVDKPATESIDDILDYEPSLGLESIASGFISNEEKDVFAAIESISDMYRDSPDFNQDRLELYTVSNESLVDRAKDMVSRFIKFIREKVTGVFKKIMDGVKALKAKIPKITKKEIDFASKYRDPDTLRADLLACAKKVEDSEIRKTTIARIERTVENFKNDMEDSAIGTKINRLLAIRDLGAVVKNIDECVKRYTRMISRLFLSNSPEESKAMVGLIDKERLAIFKEITGKEYNSSESASLNYENASVVKGSVKIDPVLVMKNVDQYFDSGITSSIEKIIASLGFTDSIVRNNSSDDTVFLDAIPAISSDLTAISNYLARISVSLSAVTQVVLRITMTMATSRDIVKNLDVGGNDLQQMMAQYPYLFE